MSTEFQGGENEISKMGKYGRSTARVSTEYRSGEHGVPDGASTEYQYSISTEYTIAGGIVFGGKTGSAISKKRCRSGSRAEVIRSITDRGGRNRGSVVRAWLGRG